MKTVLSKLFIGSGLLALLAQSAQACATCMGNSADSNLAPAMSNSMSFLLAAVMVMSGGFIYFGIYLGRRSSESIEDKE